MSRQRIGIYPGTFDPVTNGHVDIIRRSTRLVDHLIIGVAANAGKNPMFGLDERLEMVRDEVKVINGQAGTTIEVRSFSNLLMHFAGSVGAAIIVRGLRAVSDFDYEFQMVGMNARLDPSIEIVFLMASETQQFIASRLVKEIALMGGDVTSFVPPRVLTRLIHVVRQHAPSDSPSWPKKP
ncbi:MAG: pantetheine-phosphate adenylyltransferase [Alphaproteobacteria bacterium]|nr:pantetheine-phosphate adenylyltransferase [Alphaproteobacteria bacterium]